MGIEGNGPGRGLERNQTPGLYARGLAGTIDNRRSGRAQETWYAISYNVSSGQKNTSRLMQNKPRGKEHH